MGKKVEGRQGGKEKEEEKGEGSCAPTQKLLKVDAYAVHTTFALQCTCGNITLRYITALRRPE